MFTAIYISGLGNSTTKETVEKYAARYSNELQYTTSGIEYYSKIEKIYYQDDKSTLNVKIYAKPKHEKNENKEHCILSIYDFQYAKNLTESFEKRNLIIKNIFLLLLVIRKFPILLKSFFNPKFRQTFYVFGIFLIMALGIILFLPAMMSLFEKNLESFINSWGWLKNITENFKNILSIGKVMLPVIASLILFIPESATLIPRLATEFTAIDNYIQYGDQSQIIQGNLDALIEYIAENEPESKIELHTYSFGSIIAMDALFPIRNLVSKNTIERINLLITVGAPFEFVKNFYPNFYDSRNDEMTEKLTWINVYSNMDAFASSFQNKKGIINDKEIPINLNYEIARKDTFNLFSFLTLKHIRMHQSYWDDSKNGQSCTRLIFYKMKEMEFWK